MSDADRTTKRSTYHVGNLAPLLLAEARTMLAEVGPNKLSIRAVSERVGVSATATYHHFANKHALLCHLAAQGFKELHQSLRQRPNSSTPLSKMRAGCLAYFTFAQQNPQLYQLMFGPDIDAHTLPEECARARDAAFGELRQIMSEVLDQPLTSKAVFDSALASWSFTHGLASLVIHSVLEFSPAEPERLVDKAMNGFIQIFAKR